MDDHADNDADEDDEDDDDDSTTYTGPSPVLRTLQSL